MTVFHFSHSHVEPTQVRHMLMPAAISVTLITFAFTALGVYGDGSTGAEPSTREFLAICGITLAAVVVVFALVVPWALRKDTAAGTGLTLSILAVLSFPAFWAGITPALAVGGILLGLAGLGVAKGHGMSITAFAIGGLAAAAYVVIYVGDWMSTNGII